MASKLQSTGYQSISSSQKLAPRQEESLIEEDVANFRQELISSHAQKEQNFTLRGILVGLLVGLVTCFSNMYFGLQSGWISPMSMPSSLMGFAYFKMVSRHLDLPFTPVENVLVQSVAGGMGTMPLGCGLVGVMPVLNYMLTPEEQGPIFLSLWKLILWSLGLCFFGVVFAVPLRKQVIIREKLRFPSGTATALMIGMLHDKKPLIEISTSQNSVIQNPYGPSNSMNSDLESIKNHKSSWKAKSRLLAFAFIISGIYTLATYFFPILRNIPIFGSTLANSWLWTLNPSLAYVGQGAIIGPVTTIHMLLGAILGWGILSPLAKFKGWAPGPVDDWETGSRGWIVWIALAIMLVDSVISLGHIGFSTLVRYGYIYLSGPHMKSSKSNWKRFLGMSIFNNETKGYAPVIGGRNHISSDNLIADEDSFETDAPPEHRVQNSTVLIFGILSILLCVGSIHIAFGGLMPIYATIIAIFMALILSVMGVRALGETDLNPVSGISKIAQLLFAFIIPHSNKNSVLINIIAGSISEAGALQAGDLLQDLKTGHLLGAAPSAQFWGQMIGSAVGAVASALIYKLYTSVYKIPGELFQVPTGHVWIFTARLVTGQGLPTMVWQLSLCAAIIFTFFTLLRTTCAGKKWHPFIPGGIAVAVGQCSLVD